MSEEKDKKPDGKKPEQEERRDRFLDQYGDMINKQHERERQQQEQER